MNVLAIRNELVGAIGLALSVTALPLMSCAAHAGELDLRPIKVKPEPLTNLHPKL
jgi:hypothetical protein